MGERGQLPQAGGGHLATVEAERAKPGQAGQRFQVCVGEARIVGMQGFELLQRWKRLGCRIRHLAQRQLFEMLEGCQFLDACCRDLWTIPDRQCAKLFEGEELLQVRIAVAEEAKRNLHHRFTGERGVALVVVARVLPKQPQGRLFGLVGAGR
ncbi:MAG TPA: hypothetical protein VEL76_28760 [Gemmataceae bacterium]|nr:hypothetical protein [Gemmataceae bacterium]